MNRLGIIKREYDNPDGEIVSIEYTPDEIAELLSNWGIELLNETGKPIEEFLAEQGIE